jgi:hypothetical protein
MEERDHEIPVATLRPRRLSGRLSSLRGAIGRWFVERGRGAIRGRHAPLLLTGVVFSGMMLAMGYVAERANRAADAIDTMHRTQRDWMRQQQRRAAVYEVEIAHPEEAVAPLGEDPWAAAVTQPTAKPLFYVRR